MLKEKNISALPPLLKSKVAEKCVTGRYLILNTWEFYLFYFASYGVHYVPGRPEPKGASKPNKKNGDNAGWWQRSTDVIGASAKEVVADEYLDDSHAYSYLLEMYMRFFVFKSFEDELKSSKVALTFLNSEYYTSVSSEYAILSSSMLEVVLECFLNVTDLEAGSEYAVPSDLIIEDLTICVKALLRGMRSLRTLEYGPPAIAHSVRGKSGFFKTTQEDLFKQLFATTVRNRFHLFAIRAFGYAYWSHSNIRLLRYIVEIWGMMARPWALGEPSWMVPFEATPSKTGLLTAFVIGQGNALVKQFSTAIRNAKGGSGGGSSGGSKSDDKSDSRLPGSVDQSRREYVLENFILYNPTLLAFLQMAQRFSLANGKELKIMNVAMTPWVNQDLIAMVNEIESCVQKTQKARIDAVAVPHNTERVAETVKAVLKSADPTLPFLPLRSTQVLDLSKSLCARMKSHLQQKQPPKIVKQLEESLNDLSTVFGINVPDPVPFNTSDGSDGSDIRSSKSLRVNTRATSVQRVRDIKFLGDNKLRPISSDENRFLVRRSHELAQLIKRKFGIELELRLLGAYKVYLWIAFLAFFLLLLVGFIALLTADIDFGHSDYYYDAYSTGDYSDDPYSYSRQQSYSGGYR